MIEFRDMELLVALARHRHFARAASECGISQPALSMRLRNLEAALGTEVVIRGNRFEGFTEEGEIVLRWARRLLDDARKMGQEIRAAHGAVVGALNIGCVPTALPFAAKTPGLMAERYPGVLVRILSAPSLAIQQGIADGDYDAGVTYRDGVEGEMLAIRPLYEERYVLVSPTPLAPRRRGGVTWAEAAQLPLSLLVPEMQNRRIIDNAFEDVGAVPRVVSETNSFLASIGQARDGFAATILPDLVAGSTELPANVVALPLKEPEIVKEMCLIHPRGPRTLPVVDALFRVLAA